MSRWSSRARRPSRPTRRPFGSLATPFVALLALLSAACGADAPDAFVHAPDAAPDGGDDDAAAGDAGSVDPTLGGPCASADQCDDAIDCTFDTCDENLGRCRNIPDDTRCDDGVYCNGREACLPRIGCRSGPVVTCQDDNVCTIDRCVESEKSCTHAPRDLDGDGDPDGHCPSGGDCDDLDPTVGPSKAEICDNGKDDDCDGEIDEAPCTRPANDTCETALDVGASGTFFLSTIAAKKDYATSCSVVTPSAAQDVVLSLTVPGAAGDPPRDVEVWATSHVVLNEVAVTLEGTCGESATELACSRTEGSRSARAIARGVSPGQTIHAIVTTQSPTLLDVDVQFRTASPPPANEDCAAPTAVSEDAPFVVELGTASKDLASGCSDAKLGERTYAFTLGAPRDVRIFASATRGTGTPMVSLRDASCEGELRCRTGGSPPLFARSLPAGTHVFAVSATAPIDASVVVKTYPPTEPPPNQSCDAPPTLAPNAAFDVDLSGQEDAIPNGCMPGKPAAAYELVLTETSDVLVVGRFAQNELGAVSLNAPGCTTADLLACKVGTSPVRAAKRGLAPGSYRVVVADEFGQSARVSVFVRKAVPPTLVSGADGCASPGVIPETGGFFVGDTTDATADLNAGCDSPFLPLGGAPDHLFRFQLPQRRRVVFDMTGSSFTTLLDLRRGAACPGAELPDACHVGFDSGRSFLERVLDPGTYWVQVDGYAGAAGAYDLDVRVIPP